MKARIITWTISILTIILFLYTAISKLVDYPAYREQIALIPILEPVADWFAWLLPFSECIIAFLLFFTKTRLIGLYAALMLMATFTIYLTTILGGNEKLPCSCGGIIERLPWKLHLTLNGMFILLQSIGIYLLQSKSKRNEKLILNHLNQS